ncbi:putative proteasome endopeptidase complex [Helianthus debilis subsp. tardiflorus]
MAAVKGEHHHTIPLSVLLKRELVSEKTRDRGLLVVRLASLRACPKKGEDIALVKTECQRVLGDGVTTYLVFAFSGPEMVVGWYHSHPGFGCWLSGVDINTQQALVHGLNRHCYSMAINYCHDRWGPLMRA